MVVVVHFNDDRNGDQVIPVSIFMFESISASVERSKFLPNRIFMIK